MFVPRIATIIGGLLLSRGGRRLAGRNAGKLALATLAWQVWRDRQNRKAGGNAAASNKRWSGRRRA
ncbi:cysteine protease [Brevundimonas sp. S30B]|uniref:cysteine protease n=1 Tax=unclassified Brevundimonas TaxID=2622653 RepID=UPI0010723A6F|nr:MULTISPECIES: cysteine protease [unclassified Brevundimonas]QBX38251.1 cysteine protease [Brevundimonas sp. MF30-B]TFW01612.1 cysteine protease [Brevundimonas sp. S30B]